MDGTVGVEWYYAIGVFSGYNGHLPGPGPTVTQVELYVYAGETPPRRCELWKVPVSVKADVLGNQCSMQKKDDFNIQGLVPAGTCSPPPGTVVGNGARVKLVAAPGVFALDVSGKVELFGNQVAICAKVTPTSFVAGATIKLGPLDFKAQISAYMGPGQGFSLSQLTGSELKISAEIVNFEVFRLITQPIKDLIDTVDKGIQKAREAVIGLKQVLRDCKNTLEDAKRKVQNTANHVQAEIEYWKAQVNFNCEQFAAWWQWFVKQGCYATKAIGQGVLDGLKNGVQVVANAVTNTLSLAQNLVATAQIGLTAVLSGLDGLRQVLDKLRRFLKDLNKLVKFDRLGFDMGYSPEAAHVYMYAKGIAFGAPFDMKFSATVKDPLQTIVNMALNLLKNGLEKTFPSISRLIEVTQKRRLLAGEANEAVVQVLGEGFANSSVGPNDTIKYYPKPYLGPVPPQVAEPPSPEPLFLAPAVLLSFQRQTLCQNLGHVLMAGIHVVQLDNLRLDSGAIQCVLQSIAKDLQQSLGPLRVMLSFQNNKALADSLPALPQSNDDNIAMFVDLSGNQYGGSIPKGLVSQSVVFLDLGSNDLFGEPFTAFASPLPRLESVYLNDNNLTDGENTCIPSLFSPMSSLISYDISGNQFKATRLCNTRADHINDYGNVHVVMALRTPLSDSCGGCGDLEMSMNCARFAQCRNETVFKQMWQIMSSFVFDALVARGITGALEPWKNDLSAGQMGRVLRLEDRQLRNGTVQDSERTTLFTVRFPVWQSASRHDVNVLVDSLNEAQDLSNSSVGFLRAQASCPAGLMGETCRYVCQHQWVSSEMMLLQRTDAALPSSEELMAAYFPHCDGSLPQLCRQNTTCGYSIDTAFRVCVTANDRTGKLSNMCACEGALTNAMRECDQSVLRQHCFDPILSGFSLLLNETWSLTSPRIVAASAAAKMVWQHDLDVLSITCEKPSVSSTFSFQFVNETCEKVDQVKLKAFLANILISSAQKEGLKLNPTDVVIETADSKPTEQPGASINYDISIRCNDDVKSSTCLTCMHVIKTFWKTEGFRSALQLSGALPREECIRGDNYQFSDPALRSPSPEAIANIAMARQLLTSTTKPDKSKSSEGLSSGAVAGIVIVCMLLVIGLAIGVYFFLRKDPKCLSWCFNVKQTVGDKLRRAKDSLPKMKRTEAKELELSELGQSHAQSDHKDENSPEVRISQINPSNAVHSVGSEAQRPPDIPEHNRNREATMNFASPLDKASVLTDKVSMINERSSKLPTDADQVRVSLHLPTSESDVGSDGSVGFSVQTNA